MMPKRFLALTAAIAGIFAVIATANADHSWNGYRWPDSNLSPTVANKTKSTMFNVPAAVQEWSDMGTPIQPVMTTNTKGANITVAEAFSTQWLGLAQVWVSSDGFITRGQVKLNTKLLKGYPPAASDHVLCQEIGHVLGLDHNREGDSSPGDDTCMNDLVDLHRVQYPAPNEHDAEELEAIYGQTNTTSAFSGSGSSASGQGRWVTVHTFWAK